VRSLGCKTNIGSRRRTKRLLSVTIGASD